MEKKSYQTKGRRALVAFLSQNPDRQFTTEELCINVHGDREKGKSSVYRLLSQLCQEETVRKFYSTERGCNLYQYIGAACDCKMHFHEKCLACGKIQHLDCHGTAAFAEHLLQEHGFRIDCGQSVLYGGCAECRAAEGGNVNG